SVTIGVPSGRKAMSHGRANPPTVPATVTSPPGPGTVVGGAVVCVVVGAVVLDGGTSGVGGTQAASSPAAATVTAARSAGRADRRRVRARAEPGRVGSSVLRGSVAVGTVRSPGRRGQRAAAPHRHIGHRNWSAWSAAIWPRRRGRARMDAMRVLVSEKIADGGLQRLRDAGHEVDI